MGDQGAEQEQQSALQIAELAPDLKFSRSFSLPHAPAFSMAARAPRYQHPAHDHLALDLRSVSPGRHCRI
jgi:hypothetical protein